MSKAMTRGLPRRVTSDAGFTLIEVIIALALITIVMTAALTFFITSMKSVRLNQQRQTAAAVAEQQLEIMRAINLNDILCNRTTAAENAQWASPSPGVSLTGTARAYANGSTCQDTPDNAQATTFNVQPVTTAGVPQTTYTVNTYIGRCWMSSASSVTASCTRTSAPTPPPATPQPPPPAPLYRVIVDVQWHGSSCSNGCHYVATTLRDGATADPVFNVNGG